MARRHKLLNTKILAGHTLGLVEVAFHTTRLNRANMEQLPFPDENFHEDIEEQFLRNNKFTLEHIHHCNGRAFVPKVPVHIISITIENSHGDFRQLLDPYLNPDEDDRYPWFPGKIGQKTLVNQKMLDEDCNHLTAYLNKVVTHPKFRTHPATRTFFNVSCLSFVDGLSTSRKEGSLLKQSHYYNRSRRTPFDQPLITKLGKHNYEERWLVIKDTYVVYMQPDTYEILFPILVDRKFEVTHGRHHIDNYYRIKIKNIQCKIVLKCRTSLECEEWMQNFKMLIEQPYGFIGRHANRFNSYAPIRENQRAHWFINGKSYMKAVARALLTAKEEVFITDWWLSPEILMIRPTEDETYRLDNLLATVARSDRMKTALHSLSQINEDTESLDLTSTNETQIYSKSWTTKLDQLTSASKTKPDIIFITESQDSDDSDSDESFDEQQSVACIMISDNDRRHRLFIGKDYANDYEKGFEKAVAPYEDNIDRKHVPRMPWHDEALVVFGQGARDVARHFIQRWNIHKCEKNLNDDSYSFLLPKSYSDIEDLTVDNWREFLDDEPFCVDTQCVRSTSLWSSGIKSTEKSIQNAYIQMIGAAKHYIYIENQFFITIVGDRLVKNELAKALFMRIKQAHESKEKFRIYVVIPLFPGFDSLNALHAVLFFIMRSITKGGNSLFCRLEKEGITPSDYISLFGMRNYDVLMGRLVTEIIYIHSKLMIIDDSMAICGSANINDRSLLGDRDSEFCIVIKDREEVDGRFNGKPVRVGKFCIQFENPNNIDITDPVSDEFYTYFRQVARKNTEIYEKVFGTIPTNQIRTFAQSSKYSDAKYMRDTDPLRAQEELKTIQGFVVEYPIYFLHGENYLPKKGSREGIVPLVTWT
ncbi:unnamed protein product [Rotaria sp. Silwood1]|nr:unnamed protein product [Rotaria sp. Silwood1]CAF3793473.1 unnamed protein product [Rotaria sp. Silwood1]